MPNSCREGGARPNDPLPLLELLGSLRLRRVRRATGMISNLSKSADVLRGATEMQDMWADIEKSSPVKPLKGPRVVPNHIMVGKIMTAAEERDNLERTCHRRQQKTNWYMSEHQKQLDLARRGIEPAKKLTRPKTERKAIQNRLATSNTPPRPKSPMGLGHILKSGELAPGKAALVPRLDMAPKAQAGEEPQLDVSDNAKAEPQATGGWGSGWTSWFAAPASSEDKVTFREGRPGDLTAKSSSPSSRKPKSSSLKQHGLPSNRSRTGTGQESSRSRSSRTSFGGLTLQDFYFEEWKPAFTYRAAEHEVSWKEVDGFVQSTRTNEKRKMDPFADINSFTGNQASAKVVFTAVQRMQGHGHVRSLDNKTPTGTKRECRRAVDSAHVTSCKLACPAHPADTACSWIPVHRCGGAAMEGDTARELCARL